MQPIFLSIVFKNRRTQDIVVLEKIKHINGMCFFGVWRRKAPTASSAKLDGKYKRLRRVVA